METDINFDNHIKAVTKSVYYYLKNIASTRDLMSQKDPENHLANFTIVKVFF